VPSDKRTYWLIQRGVIDSDPAETAVHRAVLAHVLLFSGPVLISDSAFIRSRFLRLSLREAIKGRGDGFVRQLIDDNLLHVAIRTRGGVYQPLATSADKFIKDGKHRIAGYQPPGDHPEFRYLEDHTSPLAYSLDDATARYQTTTLRVFNDNIFTEQQLPGRYRHSIAEVLADCIRRGTEFGLSDFSEDKDLWKEFVRATRCADLYKRYGAFIHAVARGPYATFFSDSLGFRPTYSPDDQVGIECLRGIYDKEVTVMDDAYFPGKLLHLSDFAVGLSQLTAQDIHDLQSTDELTAYNSLINQRAVELVDAKDVRAALLAYRRRIDERIMSRMSGVALEETTMRTTVSRLRSPLTGVVASIVEIAMRSNPRLEAMHPYLTTAIETIRYMIDSVTDWRREDAQISGHKAELKAMRDLETRRQALVEELAQRCAQRIDASVTVERGGPVLTVGADTPTPGH
jgi:hypothetical protein